MSAIGIGLELTQSMPAACAHMLCCRNLSIAVAIQRHMLERLLQHDIMYTQQPSCFAVVFHHIVVHLFYYTISFIILVITLLAGADKANHWLQHTGQGGSCKFPPGQ